MTFPGSGKRQLPLTSRDRLHETFEDFSAFFFFYELIGSGLLPRCGKRTGMVPAVPNRLPETVPVTSAGNTACLPDGYWLIRDKGPLYQMIFELFGVPGPKLYDILSEDGILIKRDRHTNYP